MVHPHHEPVVGANKPLPPPPPDDAPVDPPPSKAGKPSTPRRATAPESPNPSSPFANGGTSSLPNRPRTRSPFTRGHARSRSSGSNLRAPQMARAHSSPVPDTTGRFPLARPASPLGSYGRHQSPLRRPSDDSFSSFGNGLDIDQTIAENAELEVTPRGALDFDSILASPSVSSHNTFPRSRRRPASPLSQIQQGPHTPRSSLRPSTSTPSLANGQFNESFPSMLSMSSSSTSTPTSLRSRSPSISSLETIPDSPDAEVEAEQIARLKAAADKEEQSEEGSRRRTNANSDLFGRTMRDKRKRWSVCGAERRGDLDLETIYEDGS